MRRTVLSIILLCTCCGALVGCGTDGSAAQQESAEPSRRTTEAETTTSHAETTIAAETTTTVTTEQTTAAVSPFVNMDRSEIVELLAADTRLTGELASNIVHVFAAENVTQDITGKADSLAYSLFQSRYQGEIVVHKVDWSARYDLMAISILADEGIDCYSVSDLDAFPRGAIKNMFLPIDDYMDLQDPLFEDVQETLGLFQWKGEHYVIPTNVTGEQCVVIYNRDTIAQSGLNDPAELLEQGNWNWDTFTEMLEQFVDTDNGRFGIDGWWFEAGLSATCGVPYIGMQDGKLVSNLKDPAVKRAQDWMYTLGVNDLVAIGDVWYGWNAVPKNIGTGETLFYPCGTWALCSDTWRKDFGENAMFVPMPKDPEAETYYTPCALDGYALLKGANNPDGAVKFAACTRLAALNEQAVAYDDQQRIESFGWTDEMIGMLHRCNALAQAHPFYDFYNSTSVELSALMDSNENGIRVASKGIAPWSESVSAIHSEVQACIDGYNRS